MVDDILAAMNDVVLNLKYLCEKGFCSFAARIGGLFFISGFFLLSFVAEAQQTIEPDVTITSKDDGQIEEYRSNGKLYMVKVTPTKGPVYYLLDTDGDGSFDTRRHRMEGDDMLAPRWKILQWK